MNTDLQTNASHTRGTRNGAVGGHRAIKAKPVTVKGKRMVLLEEAEFERLLIKADEFEPIMPDLDANGCYPALEAMRVSLAIRIIRHRRKAGLSQAELARRAGVRLSLLNRIEQGRAGASTRTIEKIDRVLCNLVDEWA
jgi:DNA-binding XRE family transcriptional regulator